MNLKNFIPSEELDDILFELAATGRLEPEEVKATIARHPQFAREICEFAIDWVEADALRSPENSARAADTAATFEADLARFWAEEAAEDVDPFNGVERSQLRAVASDCEIDVTILMQLRRRLIEAATIPLTLVERLAQGLRTTPKLFLNFLEGPPAAAAADFKSPSGAPRVGEKLSFSEAIESSPMDEALKAKWRVPGGN
ncbi:MAG TPA: hypothetical protein VF605_06140 [Allosphingosinicella sp.]|jgi:hypothetical protein